MTETMPMIKPLSVMIGAAAKKRRCGGPATYGAFFQRSSQRLSAAVSGMTVTSSSERISLGSSEIVRPIFDFNKIRFLSTNPTAAIAVSQASRAKSAIRFISSSGAVIRIA